VAVNGVLDDARVAESVSGPTEDDFQLQQG